MTRWRREAELLLARREASDELRTVHMPSHVSASALVAMDTDPEEFVSTLRRPMPRRPGTAARAGTAFHSWVEDFFGDAAIFDLDELPGSDDYVDENLDLPRLTETFRRSPWASLQPYAIELPVETPVGSLTVRGRIDAVFRTEDGWELVDWKTGRIPRVGSCGRRRASWPSTGWRSHDCAVSPWRGSRRPSTTWPRTRSCARTTSRTSRTSRGS